MLEVIVAILCYTVGALATFFAFLALHNYVKEANKPENQCDEETEG